MATGRKLPKMATNERHPQGPMQLGEGCSSGHVPGGGFTLYAGLEHQHKVRGITFGQAAKVPARLNRAHSLLVSIDAPPTGLSTRATASSGQSLG